jgi:hypothetical protein
MYRGIFHRMPGGVIRASAAMNFGPGGLDLIEKENAALARSTTNNAALNR